jgi:hypothetical protein
MASTPSRRTCRNEADDRFLTLENTMKTKLMILTAMILTSASTAQASWYQDYCSNAESTVRLAHGHNDFFVEVTERNYDGKQVREQRIREGLEYSILGDEIKVSESSQQHCNPGEEMGWTSWQKVNAMKVRITRKDGELFSEKVVGVTSDRKAVEAFVICQNDGNSMMMCPRE